MNADQTIRATGKWFAAAVGVAAGSYATYVGLTWFRFGSPKAATGDDADGPLDRFMPRYDVADRHKVRVAASAETSLSAALDLDLQRSALIRAIFKGREWIMRSKPDERVRPQGFLEEMKSLGWGVLTEEPGHEIVMGGVTKPWEPDPVFHALPPDEFAAFREPGYVKIIWTLRADPAGEHDSVFRTETRAIATDAEARRKFRWYWSFLSPGIILIRTVMLAALKAEAERRYRETHGVDRGLQGSNP